MYKPTKRVLVYGLTAGLVLAGSGISFSSQAKQTFDSSNVGIATKVGEYIVANNGDDPVSKLTNGAVKSADVKAEYEAKAKEKKEKKSKKKAKAVSVDAKEYPQFQDRAIAISDGKVNIREEATTNSDVIGTLDRGGVCLVKKIGKKWTKIASGSCEGYIANEFLAYGDDAGKWSDENGIGRRAIVNTATLKLRADKDENSNCVTLLPEGEDYYVCSVDGEWTEISVDDDIRGFVKSEYVNVSYDNPRAISVAEQEEYDRIAQEEADRAWLQYLAEQESSEEETQTADASEDDSFGGTAVGDADTASAGDSQEVEDTTDETEAEEETAAEDETVADETETTDETASTDDAETTDETEATDETETTDETTVEEVQTPSDAEEAPETEAETEAPTEQQTVAPAGQTGIDLANFALQFVGNPYVWGGTSLTNGADCSGFVLSVYAQFGISLPHDAELQANYGTEVSLSDLQPGDLLFYSNGYEIGHVTIYIGDGMVVHASNSVDGIKTSVYNYRTPVKAVRLLGQ